MAEADGRWVRAGPTEKHSELSCGFAEQHIQRTLLQDAKAEALLGPRPSRASFGVAAPFCNPMPLLPS